MKKLKMNAARLQLKTEKVTLLQPAQATSVQGGYTNISINGYKCPSWNGGCIPPTYTCASMVLGC